MLEQKTVLETLLIKQLQRSQDVWPGAGDKGQNTYLLLCQISQLVLSSVQS